MNRSVLLIILCAVLAAPAAAGAAPLVDGDVQAGKRKSARCAACHGPDGNSPSAHWPKLAGQHADYLLAQLRAFKSGTRQNAVMSGMVASLSEQDMKDLAVYYAAQEIEPGSADPALVELGRRIYKGGNAQTGVPACAACHSPTGMGNGPAGYPRLSGQYAQYVAQQLRSYRAGERGGARAGVMEGVASAMTDREIEAVSSYVAGLHPSRGGE